MAEIRKSIRLNKKAKIIYENKNEGSEIVEEEEERERKEKRKRSEDEDYHNDEDKV